MSARDKELSAFEREVDESLRIAIVHNLTGNFVGVGYEVMGERVFLIFVLVQFPSDKDCDCISEIEGEMYAYLPASVTLDSLIFLMGEQSSMDLPRLLINSKLSQ